MYKVLPDPFFRSQVNVFSPQDVKNIEFSLPPDDLVLERGKIEGKHSAMKVFTD
jgi:hypothetical protein